MGRNQMMGAVTPRGADELLDDLTASVTNGERISLLLGPDVSAPALSDPARLVELADRYASGVRHHDLAQRLARAAQGVSAAPRRLLAAYRRVFDEVLPAGAFNVVVQQAVLGAYHPADRAGSPLAGRADFARVSRFLGAQLEDDLDGWQLPPGVRAIGRLLVARAEEFTGHVLTTNVDPLIEVAIRAAGGRAVSLSVTPEVSGDEGAPYVGGAVVVHHMHGFWRPLADGGDPALSDPERWKNERVEAVGSRAAIAVRGDQLLAVGFGVPDPTVTATLRGLRPPARPVRVIWTVGTADRAAAEHLTGLATVYQGAHSDVLFPALCRRLGVPESPRSDPRWRVRHPDWEAELVSNFGS